MTKAEAEKLKKWSQDKYLAMKQRQRELEVPFEYYDGYADALSHLDEYVEKTNDETDPVLAVLDEIEKVSAEHRVLRGTTFIETIYTPKALIHQLRTQREEELNKEVEDA